MLWSAAPGSSWLTTGSSINSKEKQNYLSELVNDEKVFFTSGLGARCQYNCAVAITTLAFLLCNNGLVLLNNNLALTTV